MSKKEIFIQQEFNVAPERIYADWLSNEGHENLTGGAAEIRNELNSEYTAWDGYITGKLTELVPNQKIVQTWRTSEFAEGHEDSILEIKLEPSSNGTLLTLIHTQLADAEAVEKYTSGWQLHYIEPMIEYYNA